MWTTFTFQHSLDLDGIISIESNKNLFRHVALKIIYLDIYNQPHDNLNLSGHCLVLTVDFSKISDLK